MTSNDKQLIRYNYLIFLKKISDILVGSMFPCPIHIAEKEFLLGVLDNHMYLDEQSPKGWTWTSGDFNLRDIAVGAGLPAVTGSAHAKMSAGLANELTTRHLAVVPSGPTYIDGTTLDIHFGRQIAGAETEVHMFTGCYSDHGASIVQTDAEI